MVKVSSQHETEIITTIPQVLSEKGTPKYRTHQKITLKFK